MNLLYFNMLSVTISCALLIGGFSLRRQSVLPAVMMLSGLAGLLGVLTYNVHALMG